MPVPFELVIEYVFFSPFLFFLLLLLFGLYSLKNNSNKFKKRDKVFFLLKSFSGLWILFLITSNVLFYKAAALPLKFLTPKSIKQDADAIVVASAGVLESGAPTDASTRRAHAAALLYLEKNPPWLLLLEVLQTPIFLPPASRAFPSFSRVWESRMNTSSLKTDHQTLFKMELKQKKFWKSKVFKAFYWSHMTTICFV